MTPGQRRGGPREPEKRKTPFGDELTAARVRKEWTRQELADDLGVGLATAQRWELGTAWPTAILVRRALERFLGHPLPKKAKPRRKTAQ